MKRLFLIAVAVMLFETVQSRNSFDYSVKAYCNGVNCPSDYYCDVNSQSCLPKKELGDDCANNEECKVANSACTGSKCSCANLWSEGPNKVCVVACRNGECSSGQFCSTEYPGSCLTRIPLKGDCNNEEEAPNQCKVNNSVCNEESKCNCNEETSYENNGACPLKCQPGSCERGDVEYCDIVDGKCKPKLFLGQQCLVSTVENSCMAENSECDGSNLCVCKEGFSNFFNSSCVPKCSTEIHICDDGHQFCDIENEYCVNKLNLNDPCTSNAECMDPNAECMEGGEGSTCQCSEEFSPLNNECVRKCQAQDDCPRLQFCNSEEVCEDKRIIGGQCTESQQCREGNEESDVKCEGQLCKCADNFYQSGTNCEPVCTTNPDVKCNNTEFCHIEMGQCTPKIELNGICDKAYAAYTCKTPEAECDENTSRCTCTGQLVPSNGNCITRCSDSSCSSDSFCHTDSGLCKTKSHLGQTCASQMDSCMDPNAECNSENDVCTCKGTHLQIGSACVATCTTSDTCTDPEKQYCDANGSEKICREKVGLNSPCKYEDQCGPSNTICDEGEGKCICSQNFYEYVGTGSCRQKCNPTSGCLSSEFCSTAGQCQRLKKLGDPCEGNNECKTSSAVCSQDSNARLVCQCSNNFLQINDLCVEKCTKATVCDQGTQFCDMGSQRCFPKSPFNSGCTEDDQCLGRLANCIPGTSNLKCGCTPNAVENAGNCDCNAAFVPNGAVTRCLKKATSLQEACDEDVQCTSLGGQGDAQATCSDQKCKCKTGFVDSSNVRDCLKIAQNTEDACTEIQQCQMFGNLTIIECSEIEKKCRCISGYQFATDQKSCELSKKSDAATNIYSISLLATITSFMLFKYLI